MKIGILGTGRMGTKLAQLWAQNGYDIWLGSRDEERAIALAGAIGHRIQGAGIPETAAQSDVLVFAFPWFALTDIVRLVDKLEKKIIIDCINPIMSSGSLALGHKWSAAEEIAQQFPLAHVVKAFNGIYYANLDKPLYSGQPVSLFYCSDYDDAKAAVVQLAQEMGFAPTDCGPLKHARYLEPLAVLWLQMAFHMGMGTEMAFTLLHR